MKNLFTVAGALAALVILLSSPFIIPAEAENTIMGAHVSALDKSLAYGEPYDSGNILNHAPATYRPAGSMYDYQMSHFGYMGAMQVIMPKGAGSTYPDWLTVSLGTSDVPSIRMAGTPTASGSYEIVLAGGSRDPMKPADPPKFETEIARWTITVAEPIPPTPYTVKLISDPMPTKIETSAGTVTLTGGSATILGGTVMQAPDLQRERQILHRWTDAAGNTYDWSKPVTSDLTLTADWRDHYSVVVEGNRATVTLSPSLPTEYTTHQINWGDNTVNSELTHLYAATGDYTITVRSGQWGTWASSSTTINVVEPPTPYSVTLISDPMPTSISTSAGTVTLTNGVGTILGGTVMQAPDLQRERQILHRWTDAAGNTYDWSKPVTSDLTLTADWRDHYSVVVEGNRATVTLSPSLPTEYTTHQINWGDNTVNSELTHLYAATGDYTITVSSDQWGTWVSSSTTVSVETVTVPTYTVTFDPAGGSAVPSQTVEKGKTATEPAAPTRQGYTFQGWYKDTALYDFSTPVTGNLYLSASWTPVPPSDDDDKDDENEPNSLLLILLTALTIISLAITLFTRSPYAFALTVVLALIELALLTGALAGVIA